MITVVGDLALPAIPAVLAPAYSTGFVIGLALFALVCAAGLTWFLSRVINARVVVGEDEVVIHYLQPRPTVVPRSRVERVTTGQAPAGGRSGGSGSWLPLLHLTDGKVIPVWPLAARSEIGAGRGTGRMDGTLS